MMTPEELMKQISEERIEALAEDIRDYANRLAGDEIEPSAKSVLVLTALIKAAARTAVEISEIDSPILYLIFSAAQYDLTKKLLSHEFNAATSSHLKEHLAARKGKKK